MTALSEPPRRRVLLSWSSGKDSVWALQTLLADPAVEVVGLLTTINATHERVAMHATRVSILEAQAAAVGLPLEILPLPWPCPNEVYERRLLEMVVRARSRGVTHLAFGDLRVEEIRSYRARQLAGTGVEPLFPIWGQGTADLGIRMLDAGVEAIVTCIDPAKLPRHLIGRRFDRAFLAKLPEGVDPCGENGEYHTVVTAAPCFAGPLDVVVGETVEREGFVFADLLPGTVETPHRGVSTSNLLSHSGVPTGDLPPDQAVSMGNSMPRSTRGSSR